MVTGKVNALEFSDNRGKCNNKWVQVYKFRRRVLIRLVKQSVPLVWSQRLRVCVKVGSK